MNVDPNSPASDPSESPLEPTDHHDRLWTPWRMRYVGGARTEQGCVFCNRLAATDDRKSLILHRGEHAFIIMNLYPYNTGHTMIVPLHHVASPEDADQATTIEMGTFKAPLLRASRRALSCHGFNLGTNVGSVAGAGVAEHLHEHVVPRWTGDANFMPILANTMVLPELIPVTYAKLRAELARERTGARIVECAVLSPDGQHLLADGAGDLPTVDTDDSRPVWQTAVLAMRARFGDDLELVGWSGAGVAGPDATTRLLFQSTAPDTLLTSSAAGYKWCAISEYPELFP